MPRYEDDEDDDVRPRRARPRRRRDEEPFDDLDRMGLRQEPKPVRRPGSNTALIVGGVILGIFAICGGIAVFAITSYRNAVRDAQVQNSKNMEKMWDKAADVSKEMAQKQDRFMQDAAKRRDEIMNPNSDYGKAKSAADSIMQSVKGRRFEALHEGATAAFQKRVSVEQLQKLIESNAEHLDTFRAFEKEWGAEPSLTGTTFTFSNQLMTAFGFKTVKVTMVSESGEWKLDQFLVENRN